MIRLLARLAGRRTPTPPGMRDSSEWDHAADRLHRARDAAGHEGEQAPYWCRACAVESYHDRCWKCRGRCWARELGRFNVAPFDRKGIV